MTSRDDFPLMAHLLSRPRGGAHLTRFEAEVQNALDEIDGLRAEVAQLREDLREERFTTLSYRVAGRRFPGAF